MDIGSEQLIPVSLAFVLRYCRHHANLRDWTLVKQVKPDATYRH